MRSIRRNTRRTVARALVYTLALAALAVAGCNTVKGVGKDVEGAGKAIQGE
ncbi:MAG: entericidin A/B family lipoprotein [Phycisphaerales bacterium]|nr:entericidin A/B family lipoprotein [Phycisphaerales bacterium]